MRPLAAALVALALAGCVNDAYRSYKEAKRELDACLAANPHRPEECEPERAAADTAYARYERQAQEAWGCNNNPDRCATSHGPGPHGRED